MTEDLGNQIFLRRFASRVQIGAILITGIILWIVGFWMPVYTDMEAPFRISNELQDSPREVRFKEWHLRLAAYETPHKRLTDLGRGLIAFGLGSILAWGIETIYRRLNHKTRLPFFVVAWLALWAIQIPLSVWYYTIRQHRFDYPVWGDSIAIPIASGAVGSMVGALLSILLILVLMFRRNLPSTLELTFPSGILNRIRFVLIGFWIAALGLGTLGGVWNGDEGMVISCRAAIPLLFIVLVARRRELNPQKALINS